MSEEAPVAVLDIGSNSIKVLVAVREGPRLRELVTRTLDARISAGIGGPRPRLAEASMRRGVEAVKELLAEARRYSPGKIVIVATSAVRDAENGSEFRRLVAEAAGCDLRILSGAEEAELIGRGLHCDPSLADWDNFYLFDLGGGSLECLRFRGRHAEAEVSLPLGCVRLTENFVPDPTRAISREEIAAIGARVRSVVADSGFAFSLPPGSRAIGTGGTLTAVRLIAGARAGMSLEQTNAKIPVALLRGLLSSVGSMPLENRKRVPGLPPRRADVFPAALATLIALADLVPVSDYRHSLYNLRWGLAAEALLVP